MVTYIQVGGGTGEMAVGGKLKACVVMWVMRGALGSRAVKYAICH